MIPIYLAIDTPNYDIAAKLVTDIDDDIELKCGHTFLANNDLNACDRLRRIGRKRKLFLDRKYHDIPMQVAGGVRGDIQRLEPEFITLHTCEGIAPLRAAVDAANECAALGFYRTKLLGITILTTGTSNEATLLARSEDALKAGLDGLVCATEDISLLRLVFRKRWPSLFLMVPGIRMDGSAMHDQKRVGTPRRAMEDGADAIVIGRDITTAFDPGGTVMAIRASMTT